MRKNIKFIKSLLPFLIFLALIFVYSKSGMQKINTVVLAAQTVNVNIVNMAFSPQQVTINPGDTVTWTNQDNVSHTSTSDTQSGSEPWNSGTLSHGQSFSHTFNTPGTYTYHCSIHSMMTGTIIVSAAPTATLTPTTQPTVTPTPQVGAATATLTPTTQPTVTPTLQVGAATATPTPSATITTTITPTITTLPITGPGNAFINLGAVGIIFLIIGGVMFIALF